MPPCASNFKTSHLSWGEQNHEYFILLLPRITEPHHAGVTNMRFPPVLRGGGRLAGCSHRRQLLLSWDVGGGRLTQTIAVHAALDHLNHGGTFGVRVQDGRLGRLPEPTRGR